MKQHLLSILVVAASLAMARGQNADNSFVGTWKMNQEKSQLSGLTYKIEDAGNNSYHLVFGDRKPETLKTDGSEHMTQYGATWALKETGPNSWDFTQKRDGKVTSESKWSVSSDGQTFTSEAKATRPDGSTSNNELKMKRTGGSGKGLAGTWESTEDKVGSPTPLEIAKWENDGYSMIDPTFKSRLQFKPDGKAYPFEGPIVPKGETVSAKQSGKDELELTYTLNGKTLETDSWKLSSDGKTLTDTINYPGQSKQEVDVFDRESK